MAEQTFTLASARYNTHIGIVGQDAAQRGWWYETSAPAISNDFRPSGETDTLRVWVLDFNNTSGQVRFFVADTSSPGQTDAGGDDLTTEFETNGSIQVELGGATYLFSLAGADTSEPYQFIPSNSADSIALSNALRSAADRSATLTLRDFTPAAPAFADDTGDAISGTVGTAIANVTIPRASGAPTPTYSSEGDEPAGVTINLPIENADGSLVFDEDAIEAGSGTITIRATNSQGSDDWTVDYTFTSPIPPEDGDAEAANWLFNVPDATGEATEPPPPLALSGFSATGTVHMQMLLTVGSFTRGNGQENLWASSLWTNDGTAGQVGTLEDGSATITGITGNSPTIRRFARWDRGGTDQRLIFNSQDGDLGALFDSSGDPYRLTMVRETDTGHELITHTPPSTGGGGAFIDWRRSASNYTNEMWDALEAIADGDMVILAIHQGTASYAPPPDDFDGDAEAANWTFNVPDATGSTVAPSFDGDANAANWAFQVPDATGDTVPPAYDGDAEAANWEFDVPDASAQHTPPGTDGIAVAVNWAFDVPTATGSTVPPAFDGDAVAQSWAFEVPTATGATAIAGDANAANWLFDVPDATGDTTPPNFARDASDSNWLINVPVATGFTVAPGTDDNGDAQPASWAFQVPQAVGETVPPNFEGSALAASWAFQVPDAAGDTTPPGLGGNANAANWLFDVPTATGQTVPPGTDGVAQPANWLFNVPDATGQTVAPDLNGNANAANWTFQVPAATGQTAAPQSGNAEAAVWSFEVPATAVGASGMLADNGDANAVNWAFRVPAAEGTAVNPIVATQSSPPLFPRLEAGGGMHLDLLWEPPLNDGGGTIARYEAFLCDEAGQNCGWETVWTGGERRHRFRGLRSLGSYRVRMRAINAAGPSDESEEVEASPYLMPATITPPPGAAIPLIDADRQSLIVRLDNRDCRITVWWQPSDESWYAALEVPTNTLVVTGRRLALNAGILDRLEGDAILPGNIVVREIGESGLDPARDAWRSGNYQLKWEPSVS